VVCGIGLGVRIFIPFLPGQLRKMYFFTGNLFPDLWRTNLLERQVPFYRFENSMVVTTQGGATGNTQKLYATLNGYHKTIADTSILKPVEIEVPNSPNPN
jgi:hypothetical protein